jgi:hypothetical protein
MKKYILIIIVLINFSCSTNKSTTTYSPLSQSEFLKSPFGFEENIANFQNITKPKFKTEKVLRKNKHYPEKTDTIYKFKYKNSSIFFYKTHLNQEFLLVGKIINKQIQLKNGIRIGITKNDFIARFNKNLNWQNDSLELIGEGTKYTFIFESDHLSKIKIDNYFD